MFILTVSARPTLQLEVSFSTLSEWEQFLNSIPFRWVPLMTVSRQLGGRLLRVLTVLHPTESTRPGAWPSRTILFCEHNHSCMNRVHAHTARNTLHCRGHKSRN